MLHLALALALVTQAPTSAEHRLVLFAHDGEKFRAVGRLDPGAGSSTPIPFVTSSERVPRIVPSGRGLGLRIEGHAGVEALHVQASAVLHGRAERVVRTVDGLVCIGPPKAHSPVTQTSAWPALARLDGVSLGSETALRLPTPSAGSLVFIAGEDSPPGHLLLSGATESSLALRPGPLDACVVDAAAGFEALVLTGGARLDQVLYTDVRAAQDARHPLALRRFSLAPEAPGGALVRRHGRGPGQWMWSDPSGALRGDSVQTGRELPEAGFELGQRGVLELWFTAPPAPPAGQSWTILVEVSATPTGDSNAPWTPARAERPHAFTDATASAGLGFSHLEGPSEQLDIRPTMGPGAAWGDVDGDGWNDLYAVQGAGRSPADRLPNRLFRNVAGHFTDITRASGTGDTGAGMGALFFDATGNGSVDLFVANRGADVFYTNDGSGVFEDTSSKVGIGGELWSAGVAAADPDRDGDLDLYVTGYLHYDEAQMFSPEELASYGREDPVPMLPFAFPGERNVYLRNRSEDGSLRFEDATEELGLADALGRGMQPVFWDFDDDGDEDLYIANDVSYNALFRNEGDGTFKDVSFATGMDDPRGGMGVALGDVDGDLDEDLFLTNWELEANALYRNNLLSHTSQRSRVATFRDVTVPAGFGPYSVGYTSWGAILIDMELDGDLDLFVANGYTSPDYESTGICIGQPNHVYRNDGEGRFREVSRALSPLFQEELPSRSLSACDYDGDGDLDLLITTNNGPLRLLRNEHRREGHWLIVRLSGDAEHRNIVGTKVIIEADGRSFRRTVRAGGSYLAGNPTDLHFGFGPADSIDAMHIRWPDGFEETRTVEGVDRYLSVDR